MIHHLLNEVYCVEVPEDVEWVAIGDTQNGSCKQGLFYAVKGLDPQPWFMLPISGNWQYLFLTTNPEWGKVVERYIYSGKSSYYAYKNYLKPIPESEDDILTNKNESGESLLKSKGLTKNYAVIQKK